MLACGSVELVEITQKLARRIDRHRFAPPVAYVYNPLVYAREPHEQYVTRYGRGPKEVLMVGMNPGPFGMAQTGVPFGEVSLVRDWLCIDGEVRPPPRQHPRRPIEGFSCARSEISGARLWGWARDRFRTPERFFERFFIYNYCPLAFLEASGRNRTPAQLPIAERRALVGPCGQALRAIVEELRPDIVVGVGQWAEARARESLEGLDVRIARMLHPSPASPSANRNWVEKAEADLRAAGIRLG